MIDETTEPSQPAESGDAKRPSDGERRAQAAVEPKRAKSAVGLLRDATNGDCSRSTSARVQKMNAALRQVGTVKDTGFDAERKRPTHVSWYIAGNDFHIYSHTVFCSFSIRFPTT